MNHVMARKNGTFANQQQQERIKDIYGIYISKKIDYENKVAGAFNALEAARRQTHETIQSADDLQSQLSSKNHHLSLHSKIISPSRINQDIRK